MKKKLILWLSAVAAHTYLFYNQVQGYNAPVFSMLLIVLVGAAHRHLLTVPAWWAGAALQLTAAVAVAWHVSAWLQMFYIITLFVFLGLTYAPKSSLHLAWLNGFVAANFAGLLVNLPAFSNEFNLLLKATFRGKTRLKPSFFLMPFSVTTIFYFLYSWANPDFWVDFSFIETHINFLFIGAVFIGMTWLCPFFFPWGFESAVNLDAARSDSLVRTRRVKKWINALSLRYENRQGVLLFGMLNLLIFCFIVFNVIQLFLPDWQQSPKGFSEQVHEGFNALIISILSAIGLIVYYFRGNQNFYSERQRLIQLAVLWIVLNAFLAAFTFYKNTLYIEVFGLTYKRIWVYIALGLTLGGLVLTYIKIKKLKSNWYLLRCTSWSVYMVVVCYGLADWDRGITWYNIEKAKQTDVKYLIDLGPTVLPYLQQLLKQKDARVVGFETKIQNKINSWKYDHRLEEDWQSRTADEEWLRKIMAEQ